MLTLSTHTNMEWSIQALTLPLQYTWKISRNATDEKKNLIVTLSDGVRQGQGEAAPNIRYGETPELLLEQFDRFRKSIINESVTLDHLDETFARQQTAYALRFAIESAWFHFQAAGHRPALHQRLGVNFRDHVATSYTIPIMDPGLVASFFREHRLERFPFIKLKINRELAEDLLYVVLKLTDKPVMLDANEAFTDVEDCIRYLEKIRKLPLELVEQALPSALRDESVYLKKYCPFPLFADEAITHDADFDWLNKAFDGINMKLMKAGGYRNGVRLLQLARKQGLRTMIGCMVETTLGISSALNLSSLADYIDLDSYLLLKEEPYRLVTEENGILSFSNPERLG